MESGKVTLSFTEANYRQAMSLLITNKIPFSGTVEAGQPTHNSGSPKYLCRSCKGTCDINPGVSVDSCTGYKHYMRS